MSNGLLCKVVNEPHPKPNWFGSWKNNPSRQSGTSACFRWVTPWLISVAIKSSSWTDFKALFRITMKSDLTWEAHWHRDEARPESTDANKMGTIPYIKTRSELPPLEPLPEPSPMLRSMAANTNKISAPICWGDCFCLQIEPRKI